MSGTPKPTGLKLRLTNSLSTGPMSPSGREPTPSSAIPSSSKGTGIKIKFGGGSKASTPVETSAPALPVSSPEKTKGRTRKPSAKKIAANANGKRIHPESEDEVEEAAPPAKKAKPLKISLKKTLQVPATPTGGVNAVKLKVKGKPPVRPAGEGYDSEASDREIDPVIEDQFPLRFDENLISASGADCSDDCAYIHKMIDERKIGAGAEISFKLFDVDGRRAVVTVRKNHYAATLVALPTVLESMKSFDKKNWMKTVDISQMLLVFARIQKEDDAKTIDLPKVINRDTHDYPHGLTPPMRYARHRRWKERTRRTDIEEIEEEVDRLFQRDSEVTSTVFEWFDPDVPSRDASRALPDQQYEDENADAEGEDYDSPGEGIVYEQYEETNGEEEEVRLEDALEDAFGLGDMGTPAGEALSPMTTINACLLDQTGPSLSFAAGGSPFTTAEATSFATLGDYQIATSGATPMAEAEGATPAGAEESDDETDDDEDDDEGEEDMDEGTRAKQAALAELREDIADMQKKLDDLESQYNNNPTSIMRGRLEKTMAKVREELELKKAGLDGSEEN